MPASTILVIDADDASAKLISDTLSKVGYTVTVSGATVGRCTSTLTMKNQPGATEVHVHVTRGGPCARPKLP